MKAEFFVNNRRQIARSLNSGLMVLTAYDEMQRGADMAQPFEQEANFWYVSGISHPRWVMIYDGQRDHAWLVRPSVSQAQQIFDGSLPDAAALAQSGAQEVIDEDEFERVLRQLTRQHNTAHTIFQSPEQATFVHNPAQKQLTRRLERIFSKVSDCTIAMARRRGIKQPEEIRAIEKAVGLTMRAFERAKTELGNCRYEYQLQAPFEYEFTAAGARHAYDPIVASGANACTLHYTANADRLAKRHAVLCDIGARVDGYAADITRTYAVGEPTKRQREVHDELAAAHQQIIALLQPGLSLKQYQASVDEIMRGALSRLKLGDNEATLRNYMPHAVSHGLGIDVHDRLGGVGELAPGMVITVEPGIYIPAERIGMRIEDDILITESGARNLSRALSTDLQ